MQVLQRLLRDGIEKKNTKTRVIKMKMWNVEKYEAKSYM